METKEVEAEMTSAEFIKWASSPEGMAVLGTGSVITVGTVGTVLYRTGVAARVSADIMAKLKEGWHYRKPRAWIDKTAKAATIFVAVGIIQVSFDAAWAKTQKNDVLVSRAIDNISMKDPEMQIPPRSEFYIAISTVKSDLENL